MYVFIYTLNINKSNEAFEWEVHDSSGTGRRHRSQEERDRNERFYDRFKRGFLSTHNMHMYVCMHSSMCAELIEKAQFHHTYIVLYNYRKSFSI